MRFDGRAGDATLGVRHVTCRLFLVTVGRTGETGGGELETGRTICFPNNPERSSKAVFERSSLGHRAQISTNSVLRLSRISFEKGTFLTYMHENICASLKRACDGMLRSASADVILLIRN